MSQEAYKKIKSNYNSVIVTIIGGGTLMIIGISEYGFKKNIFDGTLLLVAINIFMYVTAYFRYLVITSNKEFICKRLFERNFKIDIHNITKIDRTPVFVIKKWGSRLQVHYKNDYSDDNWQTIRESNFSVKNIKNLLVRLKDINSSIKLHPQYQDLVDGKIEASNSFKHDEIEGRIE